MSSRDQASLGMAKDLGSLTIGWGLVALGVTLVVVSVRNAWGSWRFDSWPTAQGVIEHCDVIEVSGSRSDAEHRDRRFHLDLLYRFEVNGLQIEGTRLRFGMISGSNDPAWAREISERLSPGTEVSVHYDHSNPKRCALESGKRWGLMVAPLIGILFVAAGVKIAFL